MGNLGFGQILLLLLLFILVPLMNSIMQRFRRGLEEGTSAEEKPPAQTPSHAQAAQAPPPSTRAFRSRVRELQSRIVSTPPSRSNFTKRSLLPTTRDARRGIILMTVLGPCRAFNPRDSEEEYCGPTARADEDGARGTGHQEASTTYIMKMEWPG